MSPASYRTAPPRVVLTLYELLAAKANRLRSPPTLGRITAPCVRGWLGCRTGRARPRARWPARFARRRSARQPPTVALRLQIWRRSVSAAVEAIGGDRRRR